MKNTAFDTLESPEREGRLESRRAQSRIEGSWRMLQSRLRASQCPKLITAADETGPLAPEVDAKSIVQVGDIFAPGEHRIICGDATDPSILDLRMSGNDKARLIRPNVTRGEHHELSMARREITGLAPTTSEGNTV